ncbi:MAG: anaerobic ribonucleoside-triphosphate reductase [Methanosarcinaceae archaeon]|nr:anaerobic ribonucleoside-triphosphate reductase [Methanosarcinaceae archaeon]
MSTGVGKHNIDRLDFIDPIELVDDVLLEKNWLLKENSNTRVSPSVIDLHLASQITKRYALERLYAPDTAGAHLKGRIHIHDLHSVFKPYCNGIDGRIFLMDGLKFPDTRSQPAKRFDAAVYHVMSFMMHSQQFFAGAQAVDMFNWLLAPHLHYDTVDAERILQIIQGFVFQMNQSNRIGAQSAFTNIGLRMRCPPSLADEHAVYAGRLLDETYADFEDEARSIYGAVMEVAGNGDADGMPFTFPLVTTAITKGHDFNDPLWLDTMKAAASTGAPYFLNLAADYLEEDFVQAMCCRMLVRHAGGVWTAGGMGTGSNKIVTINLPKVALVGQDVDDFFTELDSVMDIARDALLQGQEIIRRSLYEWNILPWLLLKTDDCKPYYDFTTRHLTFGVVGLNECLLNLTGEPLVQQQELGLKVIRHMLSRTREYSSEDRIEYTLEQTPAESAAHRLAMLDRSQFRERAHVQGSGDAVYYTNSSHVPYNSTISLVDKINIEAEFHPYFTGGTINHIWMGESFPDPEGLNEFVQSLSKTKLAYFCFSPDFSVCKNGHPSRGMNERCPTCGDEVVDHISRVTGYFGHVNQWNPGKQKEYEERHRYRIEFGKK